MKKYLIYLDNKRVNTRIFSILIIFVIVILFIDANASEILIIDSSQGNSLSSKKVELACRFYGINFLQVQKQAIKKPLVFSNILKKRKVLAIIISADVLSSINIQLIIKLLHKAKYEQLPLLIMDITPNTKKDILIEISKGNISDCKELKQILPNGYYKFTQSKDVTYELAERKIPLNKRKLYYFDLNRFANVHSDVHSTIEVFFKNNIKTYPIFIRFKNPINNVFLLTKINSLKIKEKNDSYFNKYCFIEIAPILMFLRFSCGDYCWHSENYYANLTIDDPWLTKSYGHVNFLKLLKEMNDKNFHTTIAFIPWNYDRSKQTVKSIYQENPEKYSICIHGNNHDHYEFYKYEKEAGDPWPAKPLKIQKANIQQALARMEKFKSLTGLDYDKVMIFPHGIAPERTLGLLKKYNFLATVNVNNVPLDAREPEDPFFDLRSVTLKYGNFPSFKRYYPERSEFEIALDLFLDNPLLFYVHQDYFKKGIDAFNKTAEMVNSIQPNIIWQSLGYICKHYYLERLRDDGNYDVKAFTNNFIVENQNNRDITYYIQKEESFSIPIKQVTVDGEPYSHERANNNLILKLSIPKGESREVFIEYENNLDLASVDISKNDPRVNRLRKLSDFRDMTLSKNVIGRIIISIYYDTGLYKFGLRKLVALSLVMFFFTIAGMIYLIKLRRKHKA